MTATVPEQCLTLLPVYFATARFRRHETPESGNRNRRLGWGIRNSFRFVFLFRETKETRSGNSGFQIPDSGVSCLRKLAEMGCSSGYKASPQVPGPRFAGDLPRQPSLPSLSTYTSSRLSGLTRSGATQTLQRSKRSGAQTIHVLDALGACFVQERLRSVPHNQKRLRSVPSGIAQPARLSSLMMQLPSGA